MHLDPNTIYMVLYRNGESIVQPLLRIGPRSGTWSIWAQRVGYRIHPTSKKWVRLRPHMSAIIDLIILESCDWEYYMGQVLQLVDVIPIFLKAKSREIRKHNDELVARLRDQYNFRSGLENWIV